MLKLQKIELLGFKSFAERTAITFNDGGIAAIVGPNGCGKSNISDAISWVLGEQSAKNLRSGRMQDVIFNGTPGRKATGLAEVHLTLIDPDHDASFSLDASLPGSANGQSVSHAMQEEVRNAGEIVISRRLFNSGESEYLLNGRTCRLRDIQEIFLGTGLGPEAYAVIEQGRIGQILSSKPYELRGLIEEAAGVTKFKAKRKLAWAKLESSRQNLSRVNDILEEIGRQLNSLKRQASKAHRFTELREEMRAQLRIVLVSQYSDKEQEAVRVALELGMLNRDVQERIALAEARENEQRELHQIYEAQEANLRRTAEERSALRLAAERARNQASSQAQQITYLGARIDEALGEETRLGARIAEMRGERESCVSFLSEIESEMAVLSEALKESEGRFHECQNDLRGKDHNLEQLRQEMLEIVGQCATLQNQVLQLEQFLNTTGHQIERAEAELSSAEAERDAAQGRRLEVDAGMLRQREELEAIATKRRTVEDNLRTGKEDEARQRIALEQSRGQLAAERARMASLDEILARRAYSTETVQRLFETHRANGSGSNGHAPAHVAVENGSRRFEPVGVLADFIEVESAYERTVEEFLREELDYIVVKDWDSAKQGMHLLQTEVAGRATFLLHAGGSYADGNGHSVVAAEAAPVGVLGSLDSRVRFTNGFSNAPGTFLPKLRHSFLVEDAETARALASRHPDLYFLTPDGDWFQGDLVTSGKADNGGPLALKRELRELTRSVAERDEDVARSAQELVRLNETIERQQAELQSLIGEQQQAEKRMVVAEHDVKDASEVCSRVEARIELVALELKRFRNEAERSRQQLAEDATAIAQREQRRLDIQAEMAAIASATLAIQAAREEAHRQSTESRSRLAALDERRSASAGALARMDRDIEEHSSRLSALQAQCEDWRRQNTAFQESNQLLEQEASAAEQRSEDLSRKLLEMEQSYQERRARLAELEQELQTHRRELDEVRNKKSAAEVQLARLEAELGHLKESCRNELQVEIEALSAEYPATLAAEELASAEENYRHLKTKIENLGPINMMALEEFEECRQRHDFLEVQRQDLLDSIRDTTQAIEEIDQISQAQFAEAFEQINANFQETFQVLFGGGQGFLRLTEAENAADRGVEIVAQPPGKKLQNVLLLSGGEKAMTALGLLMATFRYRPSPFCVLDEVDAPLDEANIGRFTRMVQEMSRDTQFVIITHSKKTMSIAKVLYGVTMQEPGVSTIVSVKFNGNGAAPALARERELAEVGV